jgi:hypothetical protein
VLLAESGEDEVGIGDGEEVALGLGAFVGALAPEASGADGDEGLADLVAGALGVGVGVDEAGEAGLLVGLEALAAEERAAKTTARPMTRMATCLGLMPPRKRPATRTGK